MWDQAYVDDLKAENQQLTQRLAARFDNAYDLADEVLRLRKREAELFDLSNQFDALRAENERLKALNERLRQQGFDEAEKSERLRAALEKIEEVTSRPSLTETQRISTIWGLAVAALE